MNTSETWSYYALRPIDNKLISHTVSIREYESGKGLTAPGNRIYTAVDMEQWAQSFLEAIELFTGIFFSPSDNRIIHPDVARALKAKVALSEAIPKAVSALFLASPAGEDQITAARKALETALLKNLSEGYRVSTILVGKDNSVALFIPGKSTGFPNERIPVPLRLFPSVPALLSQACKATYPEATTADEAKQFDYTFRFACGPYYQDSLYIHFDKTMRISGNAAENITGLFASLAQFITTWPALKNDLPEKYDPAAQPDKVADIAMKTFADLVDRVTDAWLGYWESHSNHAPGIPANSYILTKRYRLGNPTLLDVVFLSIPEHGALTLPVIATNDTDGNLRQLTPSKISDSKWMYSPGSAMDSHGTEFEFTFTGNDLFSTTPMYPELCLLRNNFDHTDPQFVFVTGNAAFPNVDIPSIVQNEAIVLDNATTRVAALKTFFKQLLSAADTLQQLGSEVSFAIQNDGLPPLILPVLQIPNTVYSESLVSSIDEHLTSWLDAQGDVKGYFSMALAFFNEQHLPVLKLRDVRFQ